jgi:hypothetical protein
VKGQRRCWCVKIWRWQGITSARPDLPRIRISSQLAIQFSFMLPLRFLFSLVPTLVLSAGSPQIRGVHPSLLSQYKPKGTTWTCLDGNKTIPWSAVNDDYCDCIDGSDEPGIYIYICHTFRESYKPYQERARVPVIPSTA